MVGHEVLWDVLMDVTIVSANKDIDVQAMSCVCNFLGFGWWDNLGCSCIASGHM